MSSSPSSSEGSPQRLASGLSSHLPRRGGHPRPSLARTSISTQSTNRTLSSQVPWEGTDIRRDLATGWVGDDITAGREDTSPRSNSIFRNAEENVYNNNDNIMQGEDWGWRLHDNAVCPVPTFLPIDPRCTRRVHLATSDDDNSNNENNNNVKTNHQQVEGGQVEINSLGQAIMEITLRISSACQKLSIYGLWDNMSPTTALSSMERVEMDITVYLGAANVAAAPTPSPQVLLVELQRRSGDPVTFHNYRRCLLDAAEGKFNHDSFNQTDGLDKPFGRDRCNQPRASLGRPSLSRPPNIGWRNPKEAPVRLSRMDRSSISRPGPTEMVERSSGIARPSPLEDLTKLSSGARPMLSPPSSPSLTRPSLRSPSLSADDAGVAIAGLKSAEEHEGSPMSHKQEENLNGIFEKALKALNMAASLIKKDRVDARRLGMESLVLLTDPQRAGMETAKIASKVVLLGTARLDSSELDADAAVVDLLCCGDDVDALFDESAGLGIRETILEMVMNDSADEKMGALDLHGGFEGIEKEFTDNLFNLGLTVLSNALHTIEENVKAQNVRNGGCTPSPNTMPNRRLHAATEPAPISKRFIEETDSAFGCNVLSSLIRILGQARMNPHDAYHSARCLGVLFKGCGNSHRARARRDLDAKRIIAAALEVGSRSHAKLADASRVAMMALVTDDEGSTVEDEQGMEGRTVEVDQEGQQQQQQHEGLRIWDNNTNCTKTCHWL